MMAGVRALIVGERAGILLAAGGLDRRPHRSRKGGETLGIDLQLEGRRRDPGTLASSRSCAVLVETEGRIVDRPHEFGRVDLARLQRLEDGAAGHQHLGDAELAQRLAGKAGDARLEPTEIIRRS